MMRGVISMCLSMILLSSTVTSGKVATIGATSVIGPWRTAANIETATLLRLAKIPNIIAVKEASGSLPQIMDICAQKPEDFTVLSGDDALTLPILAVGGIGLVSVASNQIPKELSEMVRAALNNDWTTARKLHNHFLALMNANFLESNPGPVKAVLAMMGRIEEVLRLPMLPVKAETRSKLEKIAAEIGLLQIHATVSDL